MRAPLSPALEADYPFRCGPGVYGDSLVPADQTSAECSGPCPAGSYCPDEPTITPILTPPGYYSLDWAWKPTPCNKGTYTPAGINRESELACTPCPPHTTTLAGGAGALTGCFCERGFFRSTPSSAVCEVCPPGGICNQWNTLISTIRLEAGWWRVSNATSDLRPCPVAKPCIGNLNATTAATSVCGPGVDPAVPYCSHCLGHPSFYLDTGSGACRPCSGSRYVLLAYCGVLPFLAVGGAWLPRCMAGSARLRLARSFFLHLGQRISIKAKGKQLLGFYQIITHLHQAFGVNLPPDFKSLQRVLGIFCLDIFSLPGLEMHCFGLPSFVSRLLTRALVPLLPILVSVCYCSWRRRLERALPFILWLTFLVFSFVSSPAFQAFNCEAFDNGRSYLRADFSVICRWVWVEVPPVLRTFRIGSCILYTVERLVD